MRLYHLKVMLKSWPRRLSLSFCLLLFMLITCFSVSMLVLTPILLSSSTLESVNTIYNFTTNGFHLFSSSKIINSSLLLKKFLANFNKSYQINDSLLSIGSISSMDSETTRWIDSDGSIESDYWRPVRSSSNKFYIFSAYIDSYNRSNLNNYLELDEETDDKNYFIRIIAVTALTSKEKIICVYYSNVMKNDDGGGWFREGKMKPIREHWNLEYSAFFIYCPFPKNFLMVEEKTMKITFDGHLSMIAISALWHLPDNFNLFLKRNAQYLQTIVPSNRMSIHSLRRHDIGTNQEQNVMAVCVKPLHYHYNKTISLIEFIELNKLLGVGQFYFYNHTIDLQVDHVLRMYQKIEPSLIKILPWWLPIKSQTEIRTEGIFASLNDCLYRAKTNGFIYVIFIDLDEFIIPYHHRSLVNLVQDVQLIYPNKVGAFSFRNGFFYLQYPDDQLESIKGEHDQKLSHHLVTLSKTLRKVDLNIHKQRSKCIVFSEHTVEMGNHFVWEFTYGKHTLNIDPNIAYLHHYRVCEFGGDGCIYKSDRVIDRRVHYWAPALLKAIRQRLQSFCDSIPMLHLCKFYQAE